MAFIGSIAETLKMRNGHEFRATLAASDAAALHALLTGWQNSPENNAPAG
jgi:hypothetical protein